MLISKHNPIRANTATTIRYYPDRLLEVRVMDKFGFIIIAAAVGVAGVGRAADLPTTKSPVPTLAPGCFATFSTWLDSRAVDCPLSYAGFTVYATFDAGLGHYSQGAAWNPAVFNGTQGLISKQSNGSKWLWSPNTSISLSWASG